MKKMKAMLFLYAGAMFYAPASFSNTVDISFPTNFSHTNICQGEMVKSWDSCLGQLKLTDGTEYFGDFAQGNAHGFGYMVTSNGTRVLGSFENNQVDGLGLLVKSNGDRYAGYFKKDKLHGKGLYKKHDGSLISGKWKRDEIKEQDQEIDSNLQRLLDIDLDSYLARLKNDAIKDTPNNEMTMKTTSDFQNKKTTERNVSNVNNKDINAQLEFVIRKILTK